jgi:MbtH protein
MLIIDDIAASLSRGGPMGVEHKSSNNVFAVVANEEEQYSIWSAGSLPPVGWKLVDAYGAKEDCLAFINKTWIDMRPLSLRECIDNAKFQNFKSSTASRMDCAA